MKTSKKIVIATNNLNKLYEFRKLFKDTDYEILTLNDIGFLGEIEETGETFAENAIIKAEAIAKFSKLPVIADDSGLMVNALDGFPGIYSRRFMEDASYVLKNQEIIHRLEPYSDKSAKFVAAIALVNYEKFPQVFIGEVKGLIIDEPHGESGFGYDPIFFVPKLNKTLAEASDEEKNKISHRGKALDLLIAFLNATPPATL
ncbi:MAG TPA: RdgB/HAM1 family non-canonical purine NTP pyrophosphatase [Bacilli bacterium]|nr:RdgB/HAM1 family non-canonical purine NTP pyrophosphatase [Bacilli bacterium]